MRQILLSGAFCVILALGPQNALADEIIGSVKTVKGDVLIERSGTTTPAAIGRPLYPSDTIKTTENGAVGLVLRDDILISMGPGSVLGLKEYQFEPAESRYGMVLGLMKGTFVYLSGVIGKLAPDSIRLETPDSTVAVRGTRLLVKVN